MQSTAYKKESDGIQRLFKSYFVALLFTISYMAPFFLLVK